MRRMFELYSKGGRFNRFRAKRLCNLIRNTYSITVYPCTQVGNGLKIAHCQGITIGKTTILGDNVTIYPNVQIASSKPIGIKRGERRHAKIGSNCVLCINATILGPVEIGDDVVVAANALVTKDVPANSVVTGLNNIRPRKGNELSAN